MVHEGNINMYLIGTWLLGTNSRGKLVYEACSLIGSLIHKGKHVYMIRHLASFLYGSDLQGERVYYYRQLSPIQKGNMHTYVIGMWLALQLSRETCEHAA